MKHCFTCKPQSCVVKIFKNVKDAPELIVNSFPLAFASVAPYIQHRMCLMVTKLHIIIGTKRKEKQQHIDLLKILLNVLKINFPYTIICSVYYVLLQCVCFVGIHEYCSVSNACKGESAFTLQCIFVCNL